MNFASKTAFVALFGLFTLTNLNAQTAGSSILTHKSKSDGTILLSTPAQVYPLFTTGSNAGQGAQTLHQGQILPHLFQAKPAQATLLVNAYPNPCSKFVFVEALNSDIPLNHVVLYDVTGKKVQLPAHSQQGKVLVLQLSDVSEGIYTLAIYQENQAQATAFVKLIKQ